MDISVILPVHNAAETIVQAIDSLSAYDNPDIEIIVIDDGSTDGTTDILREHDGITLIEQPHRGIVPALNAGIAASSGRYIARMDADDISLPERLTKQAVFLDNHSDFGLVGCRVKFGGNEEQQTGYASYVDWTNQFIESDEVALNRFIESPFAHPSIMFRRELVDQFGGYRDGPFPEDYELWLRWMENGVQMTKLSETLLVWSDPPARLSRTDDRYSADAFYQTKAEYLYKWLEENNPYHPEVAIWGAGRVTRKRVAFLEQQGIQITHYIDLKPRTLDDGTRVVHYTDIPAPSQSFILSMVGNRGARDNIRKHLSQQGFVEGIHFISAA